MEQEAGRWDSINTISRQLLQRKETSPPPKSSKKSKRQKDAELHMATLSALEKYALGTAAIMGMLRGNRYV